MSDPPVIERLNEALSGRYRIERELGEGGMATVYLATDLKHERRVAIKVLKPELAAVIGGERFVAEIKTTAALQHPHILPLFDSGEADGFLYYVMPYVEGESLRERLDREKQLPVDEAVRIAGAVASALHYAHERSVVHRDIKPANILLHAGQPVVADFGIALAISAAGGGRLTETGMSVGTPHYMSPEQATADRDVDARSDVYSLACVLYEILAGEPPHAGSSARAVIMRILTEAPRDVTEARSAVPVHVRDALRRGMEKLPADRFETAADFAAALSDESFRYSSSGSPAATEERDRDWSRDRRTRALMGVIAVLLAGLAWTLARSGQGATRPDADARPLHRYVVSDSQRAASGSLGFSRNGDLAYAAVVDGTTRIRLRRSSDTASVDVPGTEGGGAPTFSPNADWIAFRTGDAGLAKVQLSTGTVVPLLPAGSLEGTGQPADWRNDGTIVFTSVPGGLYRISETGGEPELIHEAAAPAYAHILPDDRTLLFTDMSSDWGGARLVAVDLETGDTTTLVADGGKSAWSPTGHVLHGHRSGAIYALPFDLERRQPTGPSVPVQEAVFTIGNVSFFEMSSSGTLLYFPRPRDAEVVDTEQFVYGWIDTTGAGTTLPPPPTAHPHARLSPDGRTMAYTRDGQLHLFDLLLEADRRLTFEEIDHHHPVWSPDGTRLAFSAERDGGRGGRDVWALQVDGSATVQWLAGTDGHDAPEEWLGDGTLILSRWEGEAHLAESWLAGDEGSGVWATDTTEPDTEAVALLDDDWNEGFATLSPNGRWMAYLSDRAGEVHVMVTDYPGLSRRWQISDRPSAVQGPVWSRDGSAIYFIDAVGGNVRAAEFAVEPDFRPVGVRLVVDRFFGVLRDRHPDEERLLVSQAVGVGSFWRTDYMVVAVNWANQLREHLAP